ncbi:MAG: glycosyltransferase family 4 protein [Planctomycetota bacterium]|jgi:glycosyltransferase involved in cell wall biosynthesis
MRICFFTDTFLPLVGGAEMVLHNLASHLAAGGDDVIVLAPRVRGADNRVDADYAVRRYAKPFSKRYGVQQLLLPLSLLQLRRRFDVLHCHAGYPPAHVGRAFGKLFGVPMVVRPHGSDVVPGGRIRRHPRLETRLRLALGAADAVVAQGAYLRDLMLDLGVDEKRIHVIHNGVDLEAFARADPYDHPRPYVLGIGNLIRRKGFDVLLRAWAKLADPTADLLLAGDGPQRVALETLARELGVASSVHFPGAVSGRRKVALYRSAVFLVCPSRAEPFANVILEGLAAGLPVLASAVGGNLELAGGDHGVLVPSEDQEALAAALRSLLETPAQLEKMKAAVPDFIRPFDWPQTAARYRDLYCRIIDQRAAAAPS